MIGKAVLGAVVALASCGAMHPPPVPIDLRAIVRVDCGAGGGFGTAFHVGRGRWITAAHVTSRGACYMGGVPVETVRQDGDLDVSELRGPIVPAEIRVSCGGFEAMIFYRAVGYTWLEGDFYRATLPWQAMSWRDQDANLVALNGEALPGMSGGPIVNDAGEAVGVTLRRLAARSRPLSETWLCRH